MLIVWRNEIGDEVDAKQRFHEDGNEEEKEGMILAMYGESKLQNWGEVEDNGLKREDVYIALKIIHKKNRKRTARTYRRIHRKWPVWERDEKVKKSSIETSQYLE